MTVVIVGGVAGGASAAARIRRLNEHAQIIMIERSGYVSYANCGLPYYVGGVIKEQEELTLQTPESFWDRFRIDVSENRRYQEVMLQYRCALKALESRLEILNEEFSLQSDRNPIESMKSRLKSPSSIMNKMQKRGLPLDFSTMQANTMEVAGVRVICSFEEDVFFSGKVLKKTV